MKGLRMLVLVTSLQGLYNTITYCMDSITRYITITRFTILDTLLTVTRYITHSLDVSVFVCGMCHRTSLFK